MAIQASMERAVELGAAVDALAALAAHLRIESEGLRLQDAADLDEADTSDVVWLPMPFLPVDVVPAVVRAACRALRPDGWLLAGTFAGPPTRLGQLLTDLRTVRNGGHPWQPAELLDALGAAGLRDVGEVPRAWAAPVRLYAGRR